MDPLLPADSLSLENGVILDRCVRFPLIIDPSGHAIDVCIFAITVILLQSIELSMLTIATLALSYF